MVGDFLHLDRVAKVRLVGAVFAHRDIVGDARKLLRHRLAVGEGLEDAPHHGLDGRQDVILLDEAHLEVELVEFAGQPVGARVFVAEARRDLEIAVEARHHDQLLVLLRRLRQGVELARMKTARHQKVARAFGRRCSQDRCREFEEAALAHAVAHLGDDPGALDDVPVQRFAPEVEKAVLQADVFGIFGFAEDRQRQLLGHRQDLDLAGKNLDLAGRQVGVDRLGGSRLDRTVDAHDPLAAQGLGGLEGRGIRIGDNLGHAIVVAQVDEEQAAMVADAMDPAGQADIGSDIGLPEGGAGVAAVTVHGHCSDPGRWGTAPTLLGRA